MPVKKKIILGVISLFILFAIIFTYRTINNNYDDINKYTYQSILTNMASKRYEYQVTLIIYDVNQDVISTDFQSYVLDPEESITISMMVNATIEYESYRVDIDVNPIN